MDRHFCRLHESMLKVTIVKCIFICHVLINDHKELSLFLHRFSRGSVQTILPPVKRPRSGRLCSSFDDQIKSLEKDTSNMKEEAEQCRKRKRAAEEQLRGLEENLSNAKVFYSTNYTFICIIIVLYTLVLVYPVWFGGKLKV